MASKSSKNSKRPLQLNYLSRKHLKQTMNEANWKDHGDHQLAAIRESVDRNDWAKACILNTATGHLLNGHGRVMMDGPETERIPVLCGSWSPEDERYILATLDPVGQQAEANYDKLEELMSRAVDKAEGAESLQNLLETVCETHAIRLDEQQEQAITAGREAGITTLRTGEVEESSSRVIQLFYDEEEHQEFMESIDTLREAWQPEDRSVAGVLLEAAKRVRDR